MIVIFISTYLIPHILHNVQTVRFTGGFLEGEGLLLIFGVRDQGFSKVGYIV